VKFFIDNIWLVALILISGGALAWPALQKRGQRLSQLQATQLINQGKSVILDVRDPADYAAGHLRDAKNIPLKELPNRIKELDRFKDRTIIIVCKSGTQSGRAVGQLKKAGFEHVAVLDGGQEAWQAQGLPVAK
jgi:rhodanese-related sulfurtransferase